MPEPRQLHLNIKLDDSINLSKFIECDSTELLLRNLKNFLSEKPITNTIYLWGRKGVGKNYLLQSINQEYLRKNKNTAFLSFSSLDDSSSEILNGLSSLKAIFLEDIHFFPKIKDWEISLFNLINSCLEKETRIVISSEKVARDLRIELPDLKSRISGFSAIEVPEIKEQEKILALKQAASRKGMILEEKAIKYILDHTFRSLSNLLNLIAELDAYSLEKKRKLTISLIRELLTSKYSSQDK